MQFQEILYLIAQVGATLAGFASVVAILDRENAERYPVEKHMLNRMLATSFAVLFAYPGNNSRVYRASRFSVALVQRLIRYSAFHRFVLRISFKNSNLARQQSHFLPIVYCANSIPEVTRCLIINPSSLRKKSIRTINPFSYF